MINFTEQPTRVLVAMSGGVDSSVAAALLHEAGVPIIGVTLHLWDAADDEKIGRCCAPEDREDARRTCELLGVPHYVIDEREAFRKHVVDPFIEDYQQGRTPIPCVHCNRTVKLVFLTELADRFGASHIATGHYARLTQDTAGQVRLLRGRDDEKDQSYFLFGVPQPTLRRLVFPLGDLVKDESRAHARRLRLPNAEKPDSQQLCFVPDGQVNEFVRKQTGNTRPGRLIDESGAVLGEHSGVAGFTVGQRRGLGLGGGNARYVLRVVPESADVILGGAEQLYREELNADAAQWVGAEPAVEFDAEVCIRYRHRGARARVMPRSGGFSVRFEQPQRAVTPGQAAVIYKGDEVLGGGFIA